MDIVYGVDRLVVGGLEADLGSLGYTLVYSNYVRHGCEQSPPRTHQHVTNVDLHVPLAGVYVLIHELLVLLYVYIITHWTD